MRIDDSGRLQCANNLSKKSGPDRKMAHDQPY